MPRKILLAISPILVIGLLIAALASSSASAATGCDNHSLRGSYGAALSGSFYSNGTGNGAEVGDIAGAGRLTFDGHGGSVGTETDSFNGFVSSVTSTGTYSVNADCTGTATIVNSNGRTDHINIILVDGGNRFAFVDTDPGAVLAGTFTKQ